MGLMLTGKKKKFLEEHSLTKNKTLSVFLRGGEYKAVYVVIDEKFAKVDTF